MFGDEHRPKRDVGGGEDADVNSDGPVHRSRGAESRARQLRKTPRRIRISIADAGRSQAAIELPRQIAPSLFRAAAARKRSCEFALDQCKTGVVRNITLSAEADLIERARERASRENTTLNAAFREWLQRYAGQDTGSQDYAQIMRRL